MKIIIFGANSFIGKNFVKSFLEQGHDVTGTYRQENENTYFLKNNYKNLVLIQLDISNIEQFLQLPRDFDLVVIAAAVSKTSHSTESEIRNCNILGIRNVADYCKVNKINRIIYLSTMSVYGNVLSEIVNENTVIQSPDYYGQSKLEGEKILSSLNIDVLALRIPGVLGVGASRSWFPAICIKLLNNEEVEIFNPNKLFNSTLSVDDLSNFIVSNCFSNSWQGAHAFPLATQNPVSIGDVVLNAKVKLNSKSILKTIKSNRVSFLIDTSYAESKFSYKPRDTFEVLNEYVDSIKVLG